jgi:hypothetical protein
MSNSKSAHTHTGHGDHDRHTHLVPWTFLTAAIAATAGVWWISPIICTAPLVHTCWQRGKPVDVSHLGPLTIRWAIVLFVTTLLVAVFVPDRIPSSVLFGRGVESTVGQWLAGEGEPVWGLAWLAITPVALALFTLASGGILGVMILSIFIANSAVSAAMIYATGVNLFLSTLIALSPWQWAFLAGAVMLVPPLSTLSLARVFRRELTSADVKNTRQQVIRAAMLFALALVLRIALSSIYSNLAARWNVS